MSRDEITRLLDVRTTAWNARDAGTLAASHADDGTIVSPIFGSIEGMPKILASYENLFRTFPDWTAVVEPALIEGGRVAQTFTATATHSSELFGVAATGRRLEIRGVVLYDMEAGKIRHERRYYDFTGMLVQLGVLKAKPGS